MNGQSSACIHDQVRIWAQIAPDETAVTCGNEQITYGQLNHRSDVLAGRLHRAGVKPEVLVGVLTTRSADVLTAIIGIFKAGGAYLPLDCSSPATHLNMVLADAQPAVLIIERSLRSLAYQLEHQAVVIILNDIDWSGESVGTTVLPSETDRLAYVIYTSGSTGRPKGIELLHAGLNGFLAHMSRELEFSRQETMLAIASFTFDVSLFELLLPIYCGGRVAILARQVAGDGEALAAAIETYQASLLLATPGTWQVLVDTGWKGKPDLCAVSGGEQIHPSLAKELIARTRVLWNHYGPSEATIAAATYRVTGNEDVIPIGQAITDLRLFVRNAEGEAVSDTEAGELYISGPSVGRGYRNNPELSAERFVNLVEAGEAIRAYRTGDLVRHQRDGCYEFLGRIDSQVKVRGYRVELEAVEAALARHPGVKECAVISEDYGSTDRRLIAFVVGRRKRNVNRSELRVFLKRALPAYMVPNQFITLGKLPKTAHGKINRGLMRGLASGKSPTVTTTPADLEDGLEAELLAIWRRIPGFESIGVTDNFFSFGGHSLLAAKLLAAISERFDVELPLATLFDAPSIRELAREIKAGKVPRRWSPLVPIRKEGSRPPLFCVHGIGGNVLNFERLAFHLAATQPVYGLQARGLDGRPPLTTVEGMACNYIESIREVQPKGPYLIAGYSAGGVVAFEMARQLRAQQEKIALLVFLDAAMYAKRPGRDERRSVLRWREIATRTRKFMDLSSQQRKRALRRNAAYYRWLFGIRLRTRTYLFLKRLGIALAPPKRLQDAFAIAIAQYSPGKFEGDALLYRASSGDGDADPNPSMGWDLVTRRVIVERSETDHFSMLYEPHVADLAQSLDIHIQRGLGQTEHCNEVGECNSN